MNNKNELMVIEEAEKNKRVGKILIGVGIGLFIIGAILIVTSFIAYTDSIFDLNPSKSFGKLLFIILGGILNTIAIGLFVFGIILFITNNKKIKEYANKKVIPKAKETFNKVEPVVTDVIKTVGKGLERTAEEVKETIKNRNNKKGE